jgi:hypothetical protein
MVTICTPCELPHAAARSLPAAPIRLQATAVILLNAPVTLLGSWLLICFGLGGQKHIQTIALY